VVGWGFGEEKYSQICLKIRGNLACGKKRQCVVPVLVKSVFAELGEVLELIVAKTCLK
jgi:hypothetical protein